MIQFNSIQSEQMMSYLVTAVHEKYTFAIQKCLQDIKNLCPCFRKFHKRGSLNRCRNDELLWCSTFTDPVIEQTFTRSGKYQGKLVNITHNNAAQKTWSLSS